MSKSNEGTYSEQAIPTVLLDSLKSPNELRNMSIEELEKFAREIRQVICRLSERRSIHFASNLGVVELTLALHATFDFSRDRLVWDVGHQCYPHKILTGRFDRFDTLRTRGGLSGYPNPEESDYDLFMTGHAGCSVGTALGLACGDSLFELAEDVSQHESDERNSSEKKSRQNSEDERYSIAVVGDGSFVSGPIFEALNHVGGLQKKMLVILNDNKMSICKRVGGLGLYLDHIRTAPGYLGAKTHIRSLVGKIPCAYSFASRLKIALKTWLIGGVFFEDLGFRYIGPVDGHDIDSLKKCFAAFKSGNSPVLLHVLTEKGRGFPAAEHDPSQFHSSSPAKILKSKNPGGNNDVSSVEKQTSVSKKRLPAKPLASVVGASRLKSLTDDGLITPPVSDDQSFTYWASEAIYRAMRRDPHVCVVVAAMTQGNMLERVRADFPNRFFDVGICESHAVNLAAGLAKSGMRPIVAIYSGFLQRAYDQLFQETSLQNLPIVFALDRSGLVGADGATHHGVFDLSYLRPFPNIAVVTPGDASDVDGAFEFALRHTSPTAIRYPKTKTGRIVRNALPFELGKAEILREGNDGVFIVCGGGLLQTTLALADKLSDGSVDNVPKLDVGVVNARFVKPLDVAATLQGLREGKPTVTVEENMKAGGFGSAILEAANEEGLDARLLVRVGVPDRYIEHGSREEELRDVDLDESGLMRALLEARARAEQLRN